MEWSTPISRPTTCSSRRSSASSKTSRRFCPTAAPEDQRGHAAPTHRRATPAPSCPLLRLADIYFDRNADGTYGNLFDANYAVNCLDRPVPLDIASYDQLGPAFERASQVFGRATQYENLPCAYWPVPPKGHPELLDADGAPPILLVGGTGDPATPYAWAQAVHDHLVGSVLLTRRGYGHTSYDSSVCSRRAMDAYLIDLTLPAEGTVCS